MAAIVAKDGVVAAFNGVEVEVIILVAARWELLRKSARARARIVAKTENREKFRKNIY